MYKKVEFPADEYDCVHCVHELENWGVNSHCRHCKLEYAKKIKEESPKETIPIVIDNDGIF